MKFSTREDIEAPIAAVWDTISEVEAFERAAMRRGSDVVRADRMASFQVGAAWQLRFPFRGKDREVDVVIEGITSQTDVHVSFGTMNLTGNVRVELLELSPRQTRMVVQLEIKPMNLSARLLLQSLKLTKSALNKRYEMRIAEFCEGIEKRFEVFEPNFTAP